MSGAKQFESYGPEGQAQAAGDMLAALDAILASPAAPGEKLKEFDALWATARHIDRVCLRELCFLKLLKVVP